MEVAAELGMRYAVSADWEKGIPLIDEAYRRCPALPGTYRMGFSMWHFVQGRFKEALFEARKIAMPGVLYPYIMISLAPAHRLGRTREVEAGSPAAFMRSVQTTAIRSSPIWSAGMCMLILFPLWSGRFGMLGLLLLRWQPPKLRRRKPSWMACSGTRARPPGWRAVDQTRTGVHHCDVAMVSAMPERLLHGFCFIRSAHRRWFRQRISER